MLAKLNWIDILNEQATWQVYDDLIAWFSGLLGRPVCLPDRAAETFNESLNSCAGSFPLCILEKPWI